MKIEKLVKEYWKSPGYRDLSESSQRSYDHALNNIVDYFRGKEVEEIKRSDMIRFVNDKADKPASANLMLRVASVVFSYAVDMDILPYNPAARLKKLKIGSHVRWHPEEVRDAVAMGNRIVSSAVALAWYTGQREGDILQMRWRDLREGAFHLTQTKTKLEMSIKAHLDIVNYLIDVRGVEPDDYFIVSGKNPISEQAFRGRFSRAMEKLGIHKTFHGIRKGVASMLAENGRSTTEIAAILGHKTTRMAEYYAEQACGKKLASNAVDNLTSCF
jgi:integrase